MLAIILFCVEWIPDSLEHPHAIGLADAPCIYEKPVSLLQNKISTKNNL